MFLYNFNTQFWHEIKPKNYAPSSRIGACGILSFPKFYILGGKTYSGVSDEIWEYDFITNLYTKLRNSYLRFYGGQCQLLKDTIYVLGAKDESYLGFENVPFYNLINNTWASIFFRSFTSFFCEGVAVVFPGYMIEYGGQLSNKYGAANLYLYREKRDELNQNWLSNWLWWYVFAAGYTYSNSKLVFYAGGIANLVVTPSQTRPSNKFNYVHVEYIAKEFGLPLYCSKGSYLVSEYECTYCPEGSYASEIGDNNCTLCPPGTYNSKIGSTSKRQCYPCSEGYYNKAQGQKKCYSCPKMLYCPVGSIEPSTSKPKYLEQSIQPKQFNLQSSSYKIYNNFIIFGSVSLSCLVAVLLFIPFVRKKLRILDVFSTVHKNEVDHPLIPRKTTIGGLFFLFFICICCVIFGLNIIRYFLLNIEETKTLHPISVFRNDVAQFSTDFNITTTFHYYGGNCYNDTSDFISIEAYGVIGRNINKKVEKIGSDCKLHFICKDCEISSENKITFKSIEENCFTKAISINISSVSSIPESYSIMTKSIESEKNLIFIGDTPSEFAYSFTPSVFYSSISDYPSSIKGYHLTEYSPPVYGSAYTVEELTEFYKLSVDILINQRNFGLLTERYQKQSFFVLVSAVLGLISGIFSVVSFTMSLSERIYEKINKIIESKHEVERLFLRRLELNRFNDQYDHFGIKSPVVK
ncbi:hypothetical protein SteCoe_37953 [Stentor coeruleus]|uniref:Tyrosine-protein kinase ephrin type A/B receptor-like domain-containing protein n=1 Tax=Stentor coeruleus TaxID=5963 RepID=A0A1R2AM50_9CILI|nr:hypothetical protein SteCoe_37953 [Stentor coeruleus]